MKYNIENIAAFFRNYARNFNLALQSENIDPEATAGAFAGCFIEAGPFGVNCGKNDAQFRSMIPQGYTFYRNIGIISMDITAIETTGLDSIHAMTKIRWKSQYRNKNHISGAVEFEVIYFTQTIGSTPEIFAYITGDEQAALQKAGLT